MNDEQIDKAEQLLSYFGQHAESMTYGPEAAHREWWMREAAAFMRDMLPDWSAFAATPEMPKLRALLASRPPWEV